MPEHPTSGCRRTEAIHHFQVNQMSITVVNLQRFLLLLLRKVFYWYPGPNSALSHSPKTPIIIRDNKGEKGQNPKKKSTELHRGKQLWFCPSSLAADAQPAWSVDLMSPHPRPADGLSYTLCNKSNLGLFLYSFELKKKKILNLICSPVRWGIPHWLHPTPTLHSTLWKTPGRQAQKEL